MDNTLDLRKGLYTPQPSKKASQFLEDSVKSMNEGQKVFIVGICGGQGGGKTKLSKVLSKNIPHSSIIEERNFFKTLTTKRKLSAGDEPLAGEFGGYSKNRKLLLVELSNPKSYDYEALYAQGVDVTALGYGHWFVENPSGQMIDSYNDGTKEIISLTETFERPTLSLTPEEEEVYRLTR